MRDLKAVIFDFDGVILDTEWVEFHVWQIMYQRHGVKLDPMVWGECVGRSYGFFDAWAHLEELLIMMPGSLNREELEQIRVPLFHEMLAELGPLPGVTDRIAEAESLGLKLGISSSSDRTWIDKHLRQLGLTQHFKEIRTRDDVTETKPNPEVYLMTAEALGVKPEQCLVFEDSPNGSKAALAAGMLTVVVPNRVTEVLEFPKGVIREKSLEEVSIRDWMSV